MKDRIVVNGVWYVREQEQEPLDIIFYDGAVYENDDYCIEAGKDKEYDGINIEIKNKRTCESDYIDNEDFMIGVINGDKECKINSIDIDLLRRFLISLNWI